MTTRDEQINNLAQRVGQECKSIRGDVGDKTSLTTTEKGSVVGAVNEVKGNIGNIADLTTEEKNSVVGALNELKGICDDLLYEPIQITSFSNSVNTVEMGKTITDVTLTWNYNKTPASMTLDGEPVDNPTSKTKTLSGLSITQNKSWSLVAKDERNATSTKTTSITFLNGVYYGVGTVTEAEEVDNSFILGMQKSLASSKSKTFTVNSGANQYIYYAVPTRFGAVSFNVGGFDGGFTKLTTINFTNQSGYAESYDVYKSDNHSLGSTTVTCK